MAPEPQKAALDGVVVHLDTAIGEKEAKASPIFCDVF
jgi:hypothetical protein